MITLTSMLYKHYGGLVISGGVTCALVRLPSDDLLNIHFSTHAFIHKRFISVSREAKQSK